MSENIENCGQWQVSHELYNAETQATPAPRPTPKNIPCLVRDIPMKSKEDLQPPLSNQLCDMSLKPGSQVQLPKRAVGEKSAGEPATEG